jgi:hypothetical protein
MCGVPICPKFGADRKSSADRQNGANDPHETYPPRPMQSEAASGELTINRFRMMQKLVPELKAKGIEIDMGK